MDFLYLFSESKMCHFHTVIFNGIENGESNIRASIFQGCKESKVLIGSYQEIITWRIKCNITSMYMYMYSVILRLISNKLSLTLLFFRCFKYRFFKNIKMLV
jgi:hypothetical protein